MIPKRMSFFWGGSPMTWMRYLTLASFRHHNPNWDMYLYTPPTQSEGKSWASWEEDDYQYSGYDYASRLGSLKIHHRQWLPPKIGLSAAHACDLFEWNILYTEGGFYSDMDILYVAPMTAVYDEVREANAVMSLEANNDYAIGFMASSPGNPLFADIYTHALAAYNSVSYQCAGTEAIYRTAGQWPVDLVRRPQTSQETIQIMRADYHPRTIAQIPSETVYPHHWSRMGPVYEETVDLPKTTIGIHWYGGLPLSQTYNKRWTHSERSGMDPCTFAKHASRIKCE